MNTADPSDIRSAGWRVGVHNDYRLSQQDCTFWLFTRRVESFGNASYGVFVQGEGFTDTDALNAVRNLLQYLPEGVIRRWRIE